ncbi:phosphotransferase enzyme family protein [Kineococcus sp. NUM-3379]
MLPLAEIHRLARTVDDDWRSPVADAAAAAWGHPAGTARWWRSSAGHVFVLPEREGRPRAYLRLRPAERVGAGRVHAVAALTRGLHGRGVPVAPPLPSRGGNLVETVATDLGVVHVTCVEAAPGEQLDAGGISPAQAHAWGAALATVHREAAGVVVELPRALAAELPHAGDRLPAAVTSLRTDPPAAAAAREVAAALAALPRDPGRYGVVHGDFEPDNLAWVGDSPTSFDYDEAALSWYVADVAHAARDLVSRAQPTAEHRERYDALLAGYLSVRPEAARHLATLPLFARAHAAVGLAQLRDLLAAAAPPEPDVLPELRSDLTALARHHREQLLAP